MRAALLILFFVGLPIAYLYTLVHRIVTKKTRGMLLSFLVFVAAVWTAAWALSHSRTDWASFAMFAVQGEAALAGFLVLGFIEWRDSPFQSHRLVAWFGMLASLLIIVLNVVGGRRNIATNRVTRFAQAINHANPAHRVWTEKVWIANGLKQNPGREQRWLDSSVRARLQDSVFLSAAVSYDFFSPSLLDTLTGSVFQNVALGAMVNPATGPETLSQIYGTRSSSGPVVGALAQNSHTPPDVLRKIYSRPHNPIAVEIALAGNPGTPREVLQSLATSPQHPETIHALLGNVVLDCDLLGYVEAYLAGKNGARARDYNRERVSEVRPKACARGAVK